MKNKKGFTLVEVLGVITILAILALIAVPTVDNIVTKNRKKLYSSQIQTIKDGLKTWGDANALSLPEEGEESLLLTLGILKLAGFINEDIKNPNTNLCFSNDMTLSISAVNHGYSYYVDEANGLNGTEEDCSAPVATEFLYLKGNNNMVLLLDEVYVEPGFLALDINGVVPSNLVTKVIKDKNGVVVDTIDTTEATNAPYTISYTYGSNILTRTINVQIGDPAGTQYTYDYTGAVQVKELEIGTYKLETWGAQGGYRSTSAYGGYGGYSKGEITITSPTQMYIYVGGFGTAVGGFNGGGSRNAFNGGGGATDLRINTDSLYARVIVAGGGGSDGAASKLGMYGGGTTGGTSSESYGTGGYGGTQSTNPWFSLTHSTSITTNAGAYASFGYGGNGICYAGGCGGAGGGGWYGGSGSYPDGSGDDDRGGGGGSGWIYTAAAFTVWQTGNATDAASWLLNSSYYLANAQTVAGNSSMPTHDGTGTMTGNINNGYVKITKIS